MSLVGRIAALVVAAMASGAGAAQSEPFDLAQFEPYGSVGDSRIRGEAILRTVGGEVRTCAGYEAQLWPATDYVDSVFARLFKGVERGSSSTEEYRRAMSDLDPRALRFVRTTTCNSEGRFAFGGLPGGRYYLVGRVTWMAGRYSTSQGGYLMSFVRVRDGEVVERVLTR